MWRNYLTVGIRALTKNWTYAFITIFGMALGLAACLTILLYVRYELSYDGWIKGADRTFQLQQFYDSTAAGGQKGASQSIAFASRKALVKDFPQIEDAVFLTSFDATLFQDGKPTPADGFTLVDANLFDIIDLPFARGDARFALDRPGNIVLTEREAIRLFAGADPIGKTVTLGGGSRPPTDYRVTGVIRDLPKNSHLRLGMVARYDPETAYSTIMPQMLTSWGFQNGFVYAKLRPRASVAAIHAQMPAWEKRNIPDEFMGSTRYERGKDTDWRLVNIRDVHLGEAQNRVGPPSNDKGTVLTFAMVALLILGMAVVNFVNLATARASQRAREVALRKVVGASRRQLIFQFVGESILVTSLAMLLGVAATELLLPYVNAFLDADMAIHYFASDGLLLPIALLTIVVGAVGGLYPAFYLSRFHPATVLKANKSAADSQGSGRLRNLLVIGQFAVSIGLIICTAVIYAQTIYARTADAGYDREGLLQLEGFNSVTPAAQLESLRREIERVPGVRSAALTGIGVNPRNMSNIGIIRPGQPQPVSIGQYNVDAHFFDTMGMRLLAGRKFDENVALDDATLPIPPVPEAERAQRARGINVVATELASKDLGFANPQSAVGQQLKIPSGSGTETLPAIIVGVVRDARFRSVRTPIETILYRYTRNSYSYLMVRYDTASPRQVMADVEKAWRRTLPTIPFKAEFVDDRLREMYETDEARGQIFGVFALLAVVIGCLGLFGLAAFTAERRTKEIGIRKVLGARTRDIVRLLAWQFSKPVIIANLIAWPVAWWVMRDWLNSFDTRIALSPVYFLVAGALALIIAIGTIAGHATKVARANPIHALRYE